MKPLKLELRLRLENLMVKLISVNSIESVYDLQDESRILSHDIENWYSRCQDEGITGNGDEL